MSRRAGGRGAAMAFDAELIKRVEEMKNKIGYYPTLREIRMSFNPPYSFQHVHVRLQQMIIEGRLSTDATAVYKVKPREVRKNEKSVRKTGKTGVKVSSKAEGKIESKSAGKDSK